MPNQKTARVRRYPFSPEILPKIFEQGNVFEVEDGIPDGAQFRGFAHDSARNLIIIFVEHESFDLTPEGSPAPEFLIKVERKR